MKKLLLALVLLLAIPSSATTTPIGNLGTLPTLCIGNTAVGQRCFTDTTTLISLWATVNTGYSTLRKVNGSGGVGYAVTAGKTLTIAAAICANQSATGGSVSFAYGTADGGLSNASPPTGVVRIGGAGAGTDYFNSPASTGATVVAFPNWQVPQNDFPVIFNSSGANITCYAYGYEN